MVIAAGISGGNGFGVNAAAAHHAERNVNVERVLLFFSAGCFRRALGNDGSVEFRAKRGIALPGDCVLFRVAICSTWNTDDEFGKLLRLILEFGDLRVFETDDLVFLRDDLLMRPARDERESQA
jgi:hypothetical protein